MVESTTMPNKNKTDIMADFNFKIGLKIAKI
jgi:hypothetical protein